LSIAYGRLSNPSHHFLLTEFIDMNKHEHYTGHIPSFARKLAQLHSAPAPIPEGYLQPMFGFHVTTFAGTISQLNTYKRSWSEFYTNNRLLNICSIIRGKYHGEEDLTARVEQIAIQVVPRLLEAGHLGGLSGIRPVLVHGDLWIENTCRGVLGEEGKVEDFACDASSCYAHSEYELGIMRMFGGFGDSFFNEYHCLVPKTEPQDEYEDRMELYQL